MTAFMTTKQGLDIFLARLHMTMAIARHEITYEGPIRKYLTLIPLHRRMDFTPFVELAHHSPSSTPAANDGASDGDGDGKADAQSDGDSAA